MSPSLILSLLSLAWLNLPLLDFAQLSFFAVKSDIAESCTAKSVIAEFLAAESFMVALFAEKSFIVESCMADTFAGKAALLSYSTSAMQLPQKRAVFLHETIQPRLLVSWQSGLLNDCEFVESTVEGQVVGDTTWFRPAGCTSLTLINAYHCTAEGLTTNTQYVFRVRTSCADPQSSSAWSVSSLAESTLSSVQAWESNQRRLISVNIASDLDYNTVISNAEAFKSSISSETSLSLGLTAANVEVEIMASTAPTPARRLAAISAVFAVIIEGATQSESETSAQVVAGVATAVQAETGSTSTFNVTSTSLTAATAPEKISWTFMEDGQLHLQWNPLPLGDCSFLAWHVLAKVGGSGSSSPVAGCTSLSNLSHTSCIAKGLDESNSNTFTVAVLCANPAVNSMFSEASDPWPSAPSLDCDFLATLSLVGAPEVSRQFAEEVKLEVVPVLSTCAGNTDIRLNTAWQYQSGTIFVSLQEAGLLDSSPLPNTLLLKAFTLLPGSHQFRAVLQDGNDKQLDSKLFTVVVTDSAPNFIITGATAVGVGCGIELGSSVSGSFHPDVSMSQRWICLQPADCNSTISNFVSGGSSNERLVIGSNEAVLGSYQFRALAADEQWNNLNMKYQECDLYDLMEHLPKFH